LAVGVFFYQQISCPVNQTRLTLSYFGLSFVSAWLDTLSDANKGIIQFTSSFRHRFDSVGKARGSLCRLSEANNHTYFLNNNKNS